MFLRRDKHSNESTCVSKQFVKYSALQRSDVNFLLILDVPCLTFSVRQEHTWKVMKITQKYIQIVAELPFAKRNKNASIHYCIIKK